MNSSDFTIFASFQVPIQPNFITWSPDGSLIALADSSAVLIIKVETKEIIHFLKAKMMFDNTCNGPTVALHWIDNETIIGKYKKTVRVWKVGQETQQQIPDINTALQ